MLVKIGTPSDSHHVILVAIMHYSFVPLPQSASCGDGLSLSVSVLPFFCFCNCMFGRSLFSLESSLWLSFVLGCSDCFLHSSLVSAQSFSWPCRPCRSHTFLFFLFLVVSLLSHPPVLLDIVVNCGWGHSASPLTSEECQSLFPHFSVYATTKGSLWDREEWRPKVQVGS